jgi:hypothetical protein
MKNLLMAFCVLFLSLSLNTEAHAIFGGNTKKVPTPSVESVELNEIATRTNALARLVNTIKEQSPDAAGLDKLTIDNVVIAQKEKVEFSGKTLWVVKVRFDGMPMGPQLDEPTTFDMVIAVDPTGTYQFADISEIKTGNSIFAAARREMSKTNPGADVGTQLYLGTGDAKILFISDPFCGFCRNQYEYMMQHRDKIGELRHLYMPMSPVSRFVCTVMAWVNAKHDADTYGKVVEFVYMQLIDSIRPILQGSQGGNITAEQEMQILQRFIDAFPHLSDGGELRALFHYIKGEYSDVIERSLRFAANELQLRGTPNSIVNGYLVRGFNRPELDELLEIKPQ